MAVVNGLTTLQAPALRVLPLPLRAELELERAISGHLVELGLDLVAVGTDAALVFRLSELGQRPPFAVDEEVEQLLSQIADDAVARVAAETLFVVEQQPPGGC